MDIYLSIDEYANGYNVDHMNCHHISFAGAAGSFLLDNYYFYCFYYSYFMNWVEPFNDEYCLVNAILEKLGLVMKAESIHAPEDIISNIKEKIIKGLPVILFVKYNSLFYDSHYLEENFNDFHALLVSGFNSDKKVIEIREYSHIRQAIRPHIRGDMLCKLQLKEEYFLDILRGSNCTTLFYVEKKCHCEMNFIDFVEDVINIGFRKDNLIRLINSIETSKDKIMSAPNNYKIDYHCSLTMFFEGLEKGLSILQEDPKEKKSFEVSKNKYLIAREKVFGRLYNNISRGIDFDETLKLRLINEISTGNDNLLMSLSDLYKMSHEVNIVRKRNIDDENRNMLNYAIGAVASADSEERAASNAINGMLDARQEWKSEDNYNDRWLKIDLRQVVQVRKIVVYHSNIERLVTRDFVILGSKDDCDWTELVSVNNNYNKVTEHRISDGSYKYLKLVITRPCKTSKHNNARIRQFEVYGIKR